GQLQGLELPAPAWETWVLPGRVAHYDPTDLEQLCLSGLVAWGRLSRGSNDEEGESSELQLPSAESSSRRKSTRNSVIATRNLPRRRRQAPGRQAPLAFLLREDLPFFLEPGPYGDH